MDPRVWGAGLGLVLVALLLFWPATGYEFVDVDDEDFVFGNRWVLQGLSLDGVQWAFTQEHASNWIPLTFLSLMADSSWWGTGPRGYHTVNVLLHALNAGLLFWVVRRFTGHTIGALVVAAAFSFHPLRVESVAWIAERKDVLSTAFWLGTLGAYARWVEAPRPGRYVVMAVVFALGLLSKAMLVTLPFVLLLLDVWPLRRSAPWRSRVLEKLPLFALSGAASVATFLAQRAGGAVSAVERVPMADRLANAVVAYVLYILKLFWPGDLAYLYLHPVHTAAGAWPTAAVGGSVAILAALSVLLFLAFRAGHRAPWIGWLWFLGTLVPVIGIVQVGAQSHADRYTYVPHIGLLWGLVFGVLHATRERSSWRPALAGLAAVAVLAGAVGTRSILSHWSDSESLFRQALRVDPDNFYALNGLGAVQARAGQVDSAVAPLRRAVEVRPTFAEARVNLGNVLMMTNSLTEAESHLRQAQRLDPESVEARVALGNVLAASGRASAAAAEYRGALQRDRGNWQAWMNLGLVQLSTGDRAGARDSLLQAQRLNPGHPRIGTLLRQLQSGG